MNFTGSTSGEGPHSLSPDRARRFVLARTIRDLRLSASRGRVMSLSNVLRLYRRRAEAATVHHHADLAALRALYHRHQPFTSTLPRAGALSPQDVPPK